MNELPTKELLPTIKVMIVDDSAIVRQTLKEVIESDPGLEVMATAADPILAAKKLESMIPDVMTLDIEMPRMDGLSFLKTLMNQHPLPVLICSSKSAAGSENALHALEYGAVDIICKPQIGTKVYLEESQTLICDAIKAAYYSRQRKIYPLKQKPFLRVEPKLTADVMLEMPAAHSIIDTTEKIVVIGASTGGTEALREFLEKLPLDCPGLLIVQHMPEHFTKAFAQRLDSLCGISVKEAENNDSLIRGQALIAPGNKHCLLKRSGARYFVEIRDGPLVSRHRPSVDVLFRSAARYAGQNCVAIIMTGMGDDGAKGMKELNDAGAYTIAQDEASCIVFGMPREAIKLNAVKIVLPLSEIAAHLTRHLMSMYGN